MWAWDDTLWARVHAEAAEEEEGASLRWGTEVLDAGS
jgi:hypothetical protein